jgi:pilus assembly protein Flp/PilA
MQSSFRHAAGLMRHLRGFWRDTRGATAIEYAVLASCIAVVLAAVIVTTGSSLRDNIYQKVHDAYPG